MSAQLNLTRLRNLLDEQGKVAETSKTEPTGNGATKVDHPTAKLDDGTVTPTEGERGKEMTTDVNKEPAAVGNASDPSRSTEGESKQVTLGLNATGVGRDSSVEDNYTGTVKEPGVGTSSPAKFEDGQKYAADMAKCASVSDRRQLNTGLANTILADFLVLDAGNANKTAGTTPAGSPPRPTDGTPADALLNQARKEAQAGYDLARTAGIQKTAAQRELAALVESAVLEAHLVGQHIKQAMDESESEAEGVTPSAPPEGKSPGQEAGGPDTGKAEGDASGGDINQALDALGGGSAAPPPAAPPAPSGPAAGMGGPQGGGMISIDALLQALAMAQMETGRPDDAMAGAMAPSLPGGDASAQKIAADLVAYKRAGKFDSARALKTADRRLVDHMKKMLVEQTR